MWLFGPKIETVSPKDLENQLSKDLVLLDVRTKDEFARGHIRGSKNVPLSTIDHYQSKKDKEILVICQSGMRSKQAAKMLLKKGYQVKNVAGGMNAWRGPVVGGK